MRRRVDMKVIITKEKLTQAVEKGIMRWLISISHDKVTAVALAQALGE